MLPPLPASDPTPLYRRRDSLYAADLLTAALVELDLFTYLHNTPSDLDTLCHALTLAGRPADVAVTLFAAMGLISRQGDRLALTNLARGLFLVRALAHAIDLTGRRALLDVAGGSGIYACGLVERYLLSGAGFEDVRVISTVADRSAVTAQRRTNGRSAITTPPTGCVA